MYKNISQLQYVQLYIYTIVKRWYNIDSISTYYLLQYEASYYWLPNIPNMFNQYATVVEIQVGPN